MSVQLDGESKEIGVFCGSKKPDNLMSSDNELEVTFVSHDNRQAFNKGFKANYAFVTGKTVMW